MFYLGRDVVHGSGNLLLEAGFTRHASTRLKGTSRYRKELEGGARIELHGSCICRIPSRPPGIVYLRANNRLALWESDEFFPPGERGHHALRMVSAAELYQPARQLARWWLEYELWIRQRAGEGFRESCARHYAGLPRPSIWLAPGEDVDWLAGFIDSPESTPRARRRKRTSAHSS